MAKASSKDLFDDSTMTFGEHLEVLRYHVILALLGWVVAVILAFWWGEAIVRQIRRPIDQAIKSMQVTQETKTEQKTLGPGEIDASKLGQFSIDIVPATLLNALHRLVPAQVPEKIEGLPSEPVSIAVYSEELKQLQERVLKPKIVTTNAQEAFLTYMRVSMVAGTVLASPWIFYQIWQFVAAGLYPHEQKYVYRYGALSLVLFLAGAAFCFYLVMPIVLEFLLGFNSSMDLELMNRLSEYISFAVMLPLMFGISWELPLVMVFLNKVNIFSIDVYREKRRIAIFVIATLSVFLTPADPISMLLMMLPLVALYELGIVLCQFNLAKNPFHELTPV